MASLSYTAHASSPAEFTTEHYNDHDLCILGDIEPVWRYELPGLIYNEMISGSGFYIVYVFESKSIFYQEAGGGWARLILPGKLICKGRHWSYINNP